MTLYEALTRRNHHDHNIRSLCRLLVRWSPWCSPSSGAALHSNHSNSGALMKKQDMVIKDWYLAEYLADKILVKPDYSYSTEKATEPTSNWIERMTVHDKIRTANNKLAVRGLKR